MMIHQRGYFWLIKKTISLALSLVRSYHGGSSFFSAKMTKTLDGKRSLWQQTGNSCRFNGQGMEGWWIDIDFGENNWPILVGAATIMANQWSIDSWNRLHAFGFEKEKKKKREKKWLGFQQEFKLLRGIDYQIVVKWIKVSNQLI